MDAQLGGRDRRSSHASPGGAAAADAIRARRLARAALLVWAILLVAVAAGQLLNIAPGRGELYQFNLVGMFTFTLLGALIIPRRPTNPVGWLFLLIGLICAVVIFTATYSGHRIMGWANQWTPALAYGLLPLALLLFPDGRLPSRRWRVAVWALAIGLAVNVVFLALAIWDVPTLLIDPDQSLPQRAQITWRIAQVGLLVVLANTLVAAASLLARWRHADGDTRQQLKWLAAAAAIIPIIVLLQIPPLEFQVLEVYIAVVVPAAAAVAILKYRLYDIDLYLNRSLVYATLTLVVIGAYAGIVTLLGALLATRAQRFSSLVATGIIALLFQPLRERVQRGANRLLYGDRQDPYAVVSRLGARLEQALDPAAVLPQVAQTVAEALQVPYVAIELDSDSGSRLVASHGRRGIDPEAFPMTYQGQVVGRLLVSPRSPSQSFTAGERDLLQNLARQAGLAAHAARLTADLQRSRERLVRSREEERRRMRRELHDGLGPSLAGMTMQVGAARAMLAAGADPVERLLRDLEQQLQACITEVRRLVDHLRPRALDQLGLIGAIRQQVDAFSAAADGNTLEITVEAPDELGELPAAVEVAAYRIATEAVTNTVRHANARRCQVRLQLQDGLVVEVSDDGVGLGDRHPIGVGLTSMRERAEELGGSLTVERLPQHGTRIRAELP
jgi:two-component system, NarL family, sensor kinase